MPDLKVAFTNGCFDRFHDGHRKLLTRARVGHDWLIVAVNTDESVRALKGDGRPFESLRLRMEAVMRHPAVDAVIPFDGDARPLVQAIRPHAIIKGSDYTDRVILGAAFVESYGGRVILIDRIPGFSTTELNHA